ncbi:MAG: PTS sugar transporter subunit IIA [Pseudomonadota bacterium]
MNTLASLLSDADIRLDVAVADKAELLDLLGMLMEQNHGLPRSWVTPGLARREGLGSTGLGEGVAIPHCRVRDIERMRVAYLRLKAAIPFGAPDGKPVGDILVLLAPKQADDEHLRILAEVAQMFAEARFRERLHACATPREAKGVFDAWG